MTAAIRPLSRILLAGALASALAAPAFAGGDIVKCVDADGRVTITDSQCGSGDAKLLVPAALNTAPGELVTPTPATASLAPATGEALPAKHARLAVQRISMTDQVVEHDSWVDPRPRGKMLARDAATLRAARASLQALDEANSNRRIAAN